MTPQITPADAGCWLASAQGWHNTYRVAQCAMDYGWLDDKPTDQAEVERLISRYSGGDADLDLAEAMSEVSGDATEYLNGLAPEGYSFVWDAGELTLMSDSEAEEFGHFG